MQSVHPNVKYQIQGLKIRIGTLKRAKLLQKGPPNDELGGSIGLIKYINDLN